MTPFAAEISRNLSRYMRNKMRVNPKSNSGTLQKCLREYFDELYPKSVYFDTETLYITRYNKQNITIEEIVPIVFLNYSVDEISPTKITGPIGKEVLKVLSKEETIDITKYQAQLTVQFIKARKSPTTSSQKTFLRGMHRLQELTQTHTNIQNGFVCFLTNDKRLWSSNKEATNNILRDIKMQELTLFPKTDLDGYAIECFQAVWLPTRNKGYNFCLGMFDDSFIRHDYLCRLTKHPNAKKYSLTKKQKLPEDTLPLLQTNTTWTRLEKMLHAERFITNSKGKNWLWEWESEYLNDYSRLLMSPAIRRMKDKTQVFSFEDSDFHRVRLTHSLEVANVARLIGLGVNAMLSKGVEIPTKKGKTKKIRYRNIAKYNIPQILEVAGLIHDIGNPPFGHFGESTIQNFFRDPNIMHPYVRKQFDSLTQQQQQDFINFDGNVQGFRILRHLGLSTDCSSFNLNKAIVSTLVKYPFSSIEGNNKDAQDCRKHKFGYFQMEEDTFIQMRDSLGLEEGQRHPLAYLLEAADDICYMGSDIEDGWKLEYISSDSIKKAYMKGLSEEELKEIYSDEWLDLLNRIEHKDKVISANAIQSMRIRMQRYMVKQVVEYFCANVERIVKNRLKENEHELIKNIPTTKKLHDIWDELVQNCYSKIHVSQIQGGQILTALLKCYTKAVFCGNLIKYKEVKDTESSINEKIYSIKLNTDTKSGMIYETISDNFRYELSPAGQFVPQDTYEKFMLVTDFVSGMTDYYATNKYETLMIK